MENEKRLIDANALAEKIGIMKNEITHHRGGYRYCDEDERNEWDKLDSFDSLVYEAPTVDAVEVAHIEEVKQEILQTLDTLIATHRDISNSRFANSEKYLGIPESSNDYYGIYADVMEIARRLVTAAFTDLCESSSSGMRGD